MTATAEQTGVRPKDPPQFADGKAAEHPFGVLYQGEWETEHDGTAAAVRLHARALAATGLPVLLRSFSNVVVTPSGAIEPVHVAGLSSAVEAECGALRGTSIATLLPLIKHIVVRSAEHLRNVVIPRGLPIDDAIALIASRDALYAATILYSVWERDRIASDIVEQLERCGQCWVPCTQNQRMLIESGVPAERVHVVPHPFDPESTLCKLTRRRARPGRRFYSVGRWEPRKGYSELIRAFVVAFDPDDDATLTIKTSHYAWRRNYPTWEQVLAEKKLPGRWTPELVRQRITVIPRVLPPAQILKLHFDHNIYVSSSHGEAWALPAYDAKIAGNKLVHVPYGGTADFAAEDDLAVPFRMGPVDPSYGWGDAQWADYRVEDLADALHRAQTPAEHRQPAGFEARFGMQAIGRQMAEQVVQVAANLSSEAADYLREQLRSATT